MTAVWRTAVPEHCAQCITDADVQVLVVERFGFGLAVVFANKDVAIVKSQKHMTGRQRAGGPFREIS